MEQNKTYRARSSAELWEMARALEAFAIALECEGIPAADVRRDAINAGEAALAMDRSEAIAMLLDEESLLCEVVCRTVA